MGENKNQGDGDIHRLVKQRMEKADQIRSAGINPYSNDFRPELTCGRFIKAYGGYDTETLSGVTSVHTIAGRIMAMRTMGKVAFVRIRDRDGDLQIMVRKDRVGEQSFEHFKLMDLGDIVGVAGTPMRTKTGELTIAADGIRVLAKSLRPLPDKFHGLQDVEQRYRQRYVDLIMNPEIRKVFQTRTQIVRGIQKFLDDRDFIEVETPILGSQAGGAAARPFLTHHNALDLDFQLRIATELHLKRLVAGGLERVYEIGRLFRNEGISTRHNPEFTTIEFYQAYANYEDLMETTEEMLTQLVETVRGLHVVKYGERTVDFTRPWRRVPIAKLVADHLGMKEDLTGITSVERALEIVDGHCVSQEEPLEICLKELSDEEVLEWVPGLPAPESEDESATHRARRALKENAADFYKNLGRAIDEALPYHEEVEVNIADEGQNVSSETIPDMSEPLNLDAEITGGFRVTRNPPEQQLNVQRRRRLALHLLYAVFDHEVEETINNPTFITDFSVSVSPLARRRETDPAVVDRFELICAGMELANAFSELNDPVDQKARFEHQLRDRERGDLEAHGMDEDFIRALEIGMPPTAGEGIGIDRLVMLLTNNQSIREVILFPQLRPQES
jgi:lysyl-tRNA synthetase